MSPSHSGNNARMRQGQMLLHRMRRSQAIYEVLEERDGLVTVVVLDAGVLEPGSVHRFLREDVALMEPLSSRGRGSRRFESARATIAAG
jgi:hypothetical protein